MSELVYRINVYTELLEKQLSCIVPKDHRVHIHCFTDTPTFGLCLLEYFPNLHIGLTGVVCYTTKFNNADFLKQMAASDNKRILLETDVPYLVLVNLCDALKPKQLKPPFSQLLMIPWTAEFVAGVMGEGQDTKKELGIARAGAYGV
ncbi:hypothetical protein IW262DRAFT_654764 [Armillaria fumosa]|nr:hypothetical protein IW262DRAFT_654764 [Armillaria fumosa]